MSRSALGRSALAVLLSTGLTVGLGAVSGTAAAAEGPADPVSAEPKGDDAGALGERDVELLEQARAEGRSTVTVLIATARGQSAAVAQRVEGLGGRVGQRLDSIDYVRATLPTASVEKAAALQGVLATDLDQDVQREEPRVDGAQASATAAASTRVLGPQPLSNPYMPINETGAAALRQADPSYDGRGITIGVIDSGVDLDHPALQRTTTGERKIVDWVTSVDPLLEGDLSWRPMRGTRYTGPSITTSNGVYRTPAGTFFFNTFREAITQGSEPGGDVNRDGDTTDVFGVLYDPATNDTWVDQDQDRDFTDGPKLRPYREQFQVQHFGTDDPSTELVERMPFVVEFREDVSLEPAGLDEVADFVNIGIVEDAHGSHVAGITAANGRAGTGAAPGAQIVSSRACTWGGGCTAVALFEGMADLALNRGVDVINMSIGGLPALNDANNARARLYDNLIETTGVQMFISAGNSGPALNTIGDPSVAEKVVSVGSSISKATWKANYGSEVSADQNLHNFSSRGPREDGGFKPNVVAPGSAVSTVPQWLKQPDIAETGYTLPIGYAMFNGTSMASPQAAGAAALLLSAADQLGVEVTSAQLRKAMYSTAKPIPGVPTFAQGLGLIDAVKALDIVKAAPATTEFAVSAPVCTPISEFLATPDRGTGIYNRCSPADGGHAVGQSKDYRVTITRTTGPAGNRSYAVRVLGNDGTWTVPSGTLTLPLNSPRTFTVKAQPKTEGAHGAVLQLDDRTSPGIEGSFSGVVVAARPLAAPAFSTALTGTVERNRTQSLFVDVPEGTRALQVDLSGVAAGSQTRFIATDPYGVPVDSTSSLTCYTNFGDAAECNPTSRAYADPLPGVWELTLESRRTSPQLVNPFTVTATAQGVVVEPEVLEVPQAVVGTPVPVEWDVTNAFGPVTVTAEGGALGSARSQRPTIADLEVQEYEVEVPAGSTEFSASIGSTSDLAADLDLTVFRDGEQVAQSADGDSEEAVTITDPEPGTYVVEVDGYAVPSGSTEYDYLDVVTSPAYGTLAVVDPATTLAAGQTITVTGTLTAAQAVPEGRQLFGALRVLSDKGALLGTGTVLVGAVGTGEPVEPVDPDPVDPCEPGDPCDPGDPVEPGAATAAPVEQAPAAAEAPAAATTEVEAAPAAA